MRKIIAIFALGLLSGCLIEAPPVKCTHTVKNESGVPITIKSYRYENNDRIRTLSLSVGQEVSKTEKRNPPNSYSFEEFLTGNRQNDSVVVIYNNSKKTSFVGTHNCLEPVATRNPLNGCIYKGKNITFTFTAEDYENATPCNGDCE